MNRNRIITANLANQITADSALPNFLRKTSEDSDSGKTWREIAPVQGVVNYGEGNAFRPLIRPKFQNGFVHRGGDDDLTMEQAMKKGIAPPGMKPAWSPEARKKYEACVEPKIVKYKNAVDKINRLADDTFHQQRRNYIGASLGFGALSGLFGAAKSDVPIGFKFRTEAPPKRFLGKANRVMFWLTFSWSTYTYWDDRMIALRKDAEDFVEETDSFFEDVTECREKNPYDMWIQLPPGELQIKEFLESIKHPPQRKDFLNL